MRDLAIVLVILCAAAGCVTAPPGAPVSCSTVPTLEQRLVLYQQCGQALAAGVGKAVQIGTMLKGKPTDQAVIDGLGQVLMTEAPILAISVCSEAVNAARAASSCVK